MEFMTEEYVKEQAKKGVIPALECSWQHHHQGATADWVPLRDAIKTGKFVLTSGFCSSFAIATNKEYESNKERREQEIPRGDQEGLSLEYEEKVIRYRLAIRHGTAP